MNLVYITPDDSTKYGYFSVKEFHPNGSARISDDDIDNFYLPRVLIDAGNLLREASQAPVYVNSSIRSPKKNKSVGGVSGSLHLPHIQDGKTMTRAVDFGITANIKDLHAALINDGILADELRSMGIGGIGLYDTFIHLDTGAARMWDNRVSTKHGSYSPSIVFENIAKLLKKKDSEEAGDIQIDMAQGFLNNPFYPLAIVALALYLIIRK